MATQARVIDLRKTKQMPAPTATETITTRSRRQSKPKLEVRMRAGEVAEYYRVSLSTVSRWKHGKTKRGEPLRFEGPGQSQTVELGYLQDWYRRNS